MRVIRLSEYESTGSDGRKRLRWQTWNRVLQAPENSNLLASPEDEVTFDLDGFDYLNSDGLVWLLVVGEALSSARKHLFLRLPASDSVNEHLLGLGFLDAADNLFTVSNLSVLEPLWRPGLEEGSSLLGVRRIDGSVQPDLLRGFDRLAHDQSLREAMGEGEIPGEFTHDVLLPALAILQELSKNIIQHSRESWGGTGYVAIAREGGSLSLCACDAGMGFVSSLRRKKLPVSDDSDGIRRAFLFRYQPGVPDSVRGAGLFSTTRILLRVGGWFRVRSGTAEATLAVPLQPQAREDEVRDLLESRMRYHRGGVFFPGVQFSLQLRQQHG